MQGQVSKSFIRNRRRIVRSALIGIGLIGFAVTSVTASAVTPAIEASTTDASAQPPAVMVSTSPVRVLDTRPGTGPIGVSAVGKLGQGQQLDLTLAGEGDTIPADASAAILNITIDSDATSPSFLTVWPKGETRPTTSANNALPGLVAANSMVAKLGQGGISIFNQQGSVNVVIDVVGYMVPMSDVDDNGTVLIKGAGLATAATGTNGDFYIDETAKMLYGPKTNGQWPLPGISLGAGPVNGVIGGEGLLGLPLTVLETTDWTTVGSFIAPMDGNYILQANVGTTFDGGPLVATGASSTTVCRWSNNELFELGASITAGVTVDTVEVPGVETANIGLAGSASDVVAGTQIDLQCQVDEVLGENSRTELNAALTAVQVTSLN